MLQSKQAETKCKQCGIAIIQKRQGRARKYCSEKCRMRNYTQKNKSRHKYPKGVACCENCGQEYIRIKESAKKSCSHKCAQSLNRKAEVLQIRQATETRIRGGGIEDIRAYALELYLGGHNRKAVTEALGLAPHTLAHWAERYAQDDTGNWRRKSGTYTSRDYKLGVCGYSYEVAETAGEWLSCLNGIMQRDHDFNIDPTLLNRGLLIVCGVTNISKNADSLSMVIQSRLQMNPYDGRVFVFCGKTRDKIRYIYWDGNGFNVTSRRREAGTYPWPSPKYGNTMPISGADLELILCGKRDFSQAYKAYKYLQKP